jgi:AhpD family alkylhydroperoxidase
MRLSIALAAILVAAPLGRAADSDGDPRPTPLTRPTMKELLEDMKQRKPRIPLPPLTDEEKAKLGDRGTGYEARLRALYMPGGGDGRGAFGFGGGGGKDPEPNMTLDYRFKTQLFWIVSRSNNCQYCLGHQESKLLNAGMTEDEIAALDGDWAEFGPAERAAYAFARKLTFEPHRLAAADIDALRKHYTDLQILEMVLSMAGNNAINRWKEGVGVPQNAGGGGGLGRKGETSPKDASAKHSYLTPTSDAFKTRMTKVAPVEVAPKAGDVTAPTVCKRPVLESREETERALAAARSRTPRLPLVVEAKARELLPADWPAGALPEWVRLLANFPAQGKARILSQRTAEENGDLSPVLKAQVAWIIARQDRAWYAAGRAKARLNELSQTDDQVYRLDGDWSEFTPAERALLTVARKLAASPVVLTDADVAEALKLTGPRDVVQVVNFVTVCASFDRITEAAGLRLQK